MWSGFATTGVQHSRPQLWLGGGVQRRCIQYWIREFMRTADCHPGKSRDHTTLSSGTVIAGQSVHDTATLTSATNTAGGTVTYGYFGNSACTGTATKVGLRRYSDERHGAGFGISNIQQCRLLRLERNLQRRREQPGTGNEPMRAAHCPVSFIPFNDSYGSVDRHRWLGARLRDAYRRHQHCRRNRHLWVPSETAPAPAPPL